jgi:hypothetical protein
LSEYARLGGSATSRAKTKAARANAKLGGWPKGRKRGKRKHAPSSPANNRKPKRKEKRGRHPKARAKDANQVAFDVVQKAGKAVVDWPAFGKAFTQQGQPPRLPKVLPSPTAPKRGR